MLSFSQSNPFARRESQSVEAVWTYKVLTIISWLLVVVTSINYTFAVPQHDVQLWRNTIWGQNKAFPTPFALNALMASLYWLALFLSQIAYMWHLFSKNNDHVIAAAGVGSHFIFNNLLQFAWIMLFVRGHFVWSEVIAVINFFNLSSLYFRHNTYARAIHVPAVTGPLAWNFVALYWNGAIAVNAHTLPARILANVAIWGILVYGMFFLIIYKDYTMGFALSYLTACLGVGQFFTKTFAFQWIFAFTIMATLFFATLVIAIPGIFGKEFSFRTEQNVVPADQERAPLLEDA
ncbi:uncharacterized protein L3040_002197 [Drepanopeziza brunnea f. sp. 'multigermtubi']|uniref:ATP synthase F0 n=1 Tax=Marssonina brunnea f. sp. multigermtubi (strain MB_m1) TaxID=1072389 RepID=K1WR80_MARBU|nr:ATP synthase F0 [Drepanopeziza brunnea f. sp. 'multigermtubi' MB_m1]EKD20130.1 ATP synthase F0 [Drepanopeziza brunnea f. sp. 'multigermtubi' MB_m1]KAJ5050314.1 hypothetical protein L3040_002197 [Drepanopeziza brunnea f. sp. 'multigermtubi']